MIELNDDNDPYLFAVTLPSGRIVIQYLEVLCALKEVMPDGREPNVDELAAAIRKAARTKEAAASATAAELFSAWVRVNARATELGNVTGRPQGS